MVSREALVEESHSAPWTEPSVKLRLDQFLCFCWNPIRKLIIYICINGESSVFDKPLPRNCATAENKEGKNNKKVTTSFFATRRIVFFFYSFDKLSPVFPLKKIHSEPSRECKTHRLRLVNILQTIFLKRLRQPRKRGAIIASSLFLKVDGVRAAFETQAASHVGPDLPCLSSGASPFSPRV